MGKAPSKKELLAELEKTREQMEHLAVANAQNIQRINTTIPTPQIASTAMVGVRNVSDYAVGVAGKYGEPDLNLAPDFNDGNPGSGGVISYAWWRELRKSKFVAQGLITRDDSILGPGYLRAPEDREEDLPAGIAHNIVHNPKEWIESRTEDEIRAGLSKVTSDCTLRRIRRGVDMKLDKIKATLAHLDKNDAVRAAWSMLPMKYRLVDEVTTHRLERPEDFVH